jgi:hypothetical protein
VVAVEAKDEVAGADEAGGGNELRGELDLGVRNLLQKSWVRVNCSYDKRTCVFSYDGASPGILYVDRATIYVDRATIYTLIGVRRDQREQRFDLYDKQRGVIELAAPLLVVQVDR